MKVEMATHRALSLLNFQQCRAHREATSLGIPLNLAERCDCCQRPITKQKLNFCFSQQKLEHLGKGTALFFRFSLFATILTAILGVGFSVYLLILNARGSYCQEQNNGCSAFPLVKYSWANASSSRSYSTMLAAFCMGLFFIFLISGLMFARLLLRFKKPSKDYYPNQYSILLRFKQAKNYSEQTIIKALKQWWEVEMKITLGDQSHRNNLLNSTVSNAYSVKGSDFIERVYFYFNLQLFQEIRKELRDLEEQKQREREAEDSEDLRGSGKFSNSGSSYREIMSKINRIEQLKLMLHNKELEKTNKCIVSFSEKRYATFFKQQTHKNCGEKQLNKVLLPGNNFVEILEAPFPSNNFYEIQHLPYKTKVKQRLCMNFAILGIAILSAGLIFAIIYVSLLQGTNANSFFSPIVALVTISTSSFVCTVSRNLAKTEKQPNKIDQTLSKIRKNSIAGTLVQILPLTLGYFLDGTSKLWNQGNFIQTASYLLLLNLFLPHLEKFINYNTISRKYLFKVVNGLEKQKDPKILSEYTQKQILEMSLKPKQKFDEQYSWILIQMNLSFFFAPFLPYALLITPISLLINYLTLRLSFLHIYREPNPSCPTIFHKVYKLFLASSFWLGMGLLTLFFYEILNHGAAFEWWKAAAPALIIVISVLTLFMSDWPVPIAHKDQRQQLYMDAMQQFIHNYDEFNPIYQFKSHHTCRLALNKSVVLIEELNTMSKSLQGTLKDKLFEKIPTIRLENLGEKLNESLDIYFQYEIKVKMPQKKPGYSHSKIPPIFKPSSKDEEMKKNYKKIAEKEELIKLNRLFSTEEDGEEKTKKKLKQAIKGSIKLKQKYNRAGLK